MHIGFVSTRFEGTDGVSLETTKWRMILERLGHSSYFCAGSLDEDHLPGMRIPEMHFHHAEVFRLHNEAFREAPTPPDFHDRLHTIADRIYIALLRFIEAFRIDLLIPENALTIPMNLPLGMALKHLIAETHIPTLAHHHDFYWERERFSRHTIGDILDTVFPPDLPEIRHVVINRAAQRSLKTRRGLASTIIPNVFDFNRAARGISPHNRDLRSDLGLSEDHLLILQPTRVVQRKGIEQAITLVRELRRQKRKLLGKEPVLVISHHAGDEGMDYLHSLQQMAQRWRVPFYYTPQHFHPHPNRRNGHKYSLWDAYVHADFVTYPSRHEGFGNALLEAVYFRLPVMVNRYMVYREDIAPLGFDMIEIDGTVSPEAVEAVITVLRDPVRRRRMVEHNYQLAREHFSYEAVLPIFENLLTSPFPQSGQNPPSKKQHPERGH